MSETTDPTDPRLGHGSDDHQVPQNAAYLVLGEAERKQGFIRPVRRTYLHQFMPDGSPVPPEPWIKKPDGLQGCGVATTMSQAIAETYARDPKFYGSTYCVGCRMHLPVDQFTWDGTNQPVGS